MQRTYLNQYRATTSSTGYMLQNVPSETRYGSPKGYTKAITFSEQGFYCRDIIMQTRCHAMSTYSYNVTSTCHQCFALGYRSYSFHTPSNGANNGGFSNYNGTQTNGRGPPNGGTSSRNYGHEVCNTFCSNVLFCKDASSFNEAGRPCI